MSACRHTHPISTGVSKYLAWEERVGGVGFKWSYPFFTVPIEVDDNANVRKKQNNEDLLSRYRVTGIRRVYGGESGREGHRVGRSGDAEPGRRRGGEA